MDPAQLFAKAKEYLPPEKLAIVEAAYAYAYNAHDGQKRKSGAPFLEHPLQTAVTLANLQLDASTLAAALLHDVPEDCNIPVAKLEEKFGPEISNLVDGVTKLSKVEWKREVAATSQESQAENLRKMLIAMAEDLRVVFIKLADRLHNMDTLEVLPEERRHAIAQETLEIYAPLAHRLGIWQIKWQLEDLAFRYLDPQQYRDIARMVSIRRAQREGFIEEIAAVLREEMAKAGIEGDVTGRPKHIYSIYHKIRKYAAIGRDFGDIHDLFALRVLVNDVSDCYKLLGIIHNLWHPITDEFNDYIANPKENGYQSLHTTVLTKGTTPLEIQIRTYEMHRMSEYGVAAHWRYKEGAKPDLHFEEKISWLRQLIDWQSSLDSKEFLESLKQDTFSDQVFVYTPKGEIKAFPKGATPLDFAYRIHTDLGHRCIGGKVNGRLVSLNYDLKNGDVVEIMVSKTEKAPSLDWLNPDLGYVKTAHAKEKIRAWYKKQERTQNIERGRSILEKELKRLGIDVTNFEELGKELGYEDVDDFLAAAGYGGITPHQIAIKLAGEPEEPLETPAKVAQPTKTKSSGIQVLGVGDLLTHLAKCCHPVPGDDIIGYITRTHGITVHRKNCINIVNEEEKERLIDVSWGEVADVYAVAIQVEAYDRVGLLRDLTTVIAEEKINIISVNSQHKEDVFTMYATIEIKNMAQLTHILNKIMGLRGVINATKAQYTQANISS
ncbi:MAG: bifunctional (p)ppGpp synthetase/guanosine-3',5'-bis(diphosphate) 3'-pyrophosphohydrolase [Dehalococcoidia bacterium]|nr:bifunctional (p)ppGpp synthetase/guanosine-3',5'-bis(diphosphate) 3'-pyrophosphohydrolase [Dehalococcoidia bacterium]MDD5493674.1 bifunctional (p)ppGpp synthetase/guanosine-3',5'-bis(diphosphate) 3'-pyrophosphohydrolase [Dehalococcoidia bacterium]